MTFDSFFGLSVLLCIALLIFGLVKGFSWFIIKGALINGPGFIASVWATLAGISYGVTTPNGAWWFLAIVGVLFGFVCGYNLYNYLSGKEADMLARMARERFREMTGGRE